MFIVAQPIQRSAGGIVLALAHELKLKVLFVGDGEGVGDLRRFDGKAFVDAIFAGV